MKPNPNSISAEYGPRVAQLDVTADKTFGTFGLSQLDNQGWAARTKRGGTFDLQQMGATTVAIKVIVELQAKPGKRNELKNLLADAIPSVGPLPGYLGGSLNEAVDDPDMLIEIAEWESAEARMAVMQQAMESDFFKSIDDLLAGPFRATLVKQLS